MVCFKCLGSHNVKSPEKEIIFRREERKRKLQDFLIKQNLNKRISQYPNRKRYSFRGEKIISRKPGRKIARFKKETPRVQSVALFRRALSNTRILSSTKRNYPRKRREKIAGSFFKRGLVRGVQTREKELLFELKKENWILEEKKKKKKETEGTEAFPIESSRAICRSDKSVPRMRMLHSEMSREMIVQRERASPERKLQSFSIKRDPIYRLLTKQMRIATSKRGARASIDRKTQRCL